MSNGCPKIHSSEKTLSSEKTWDNRVLIRSGEARLVGWSRSMLYSGFNILPRSVFWLADLNGRSDNTDVIQLFHFFWVDFPLPQPKKQQWRIRFSLRLLFALLTVTTLFCGWRYHQRTELQNIARKLQERDGTIFYQWQDPAVRRSLAFFPLPPREREYQVTLPDGSLATRTWQEPVENDDFNLHQLCARCGDYTGFRAIDFLFGYHTDVKIAAISMPAASIDQETLHLLSRIENLDELLLEIDVAIFKADRIARRQKTRSGDSLGAQRSEDFEHMCEDLRHAVKLVQEHLPSVSVPVQVNLPSGY